MIIMIIIMITIMIDEEARTYAFQGVRQKLLSGSSASAKEVSPPHLLPPSGKSFCQKNLSGKWGGPTLISPLTQPRRRKAITPGMEWTGD